MAENSSLWYTALYIVSVPFRVKLWFTKNSQNTNKTKIMLACYAVVYLQLHNFNCSPNHNNNQIFYLSN